MSRRAWAWQPRVGVGAVRFGETFSGPASEGFVLKDSDDDGSDVWREYEWVDEGVRVITCDGIVVSIACDRSFLIDGTECIGLPAARAMRLVGAEVSCESDAGLGQFLEFESLGLELLLQDGLVSIASVTEDPDRFLAPG